MLQEIQRLLDQFKIFYENKLSAVDNNTSMTNEEILQMKLDILQAYVTDLAEQNLHLIETSAVLQTEAEARVKILEKLVDKTAEKSRDYIYSINKFHQAILEEDQPKKSVFQAIQSKIKKLEEEREAIGNLNVHLTEKLSNLIQVINQARSTGCWDTTNELYLDDLDVFSPSKKAIFANNFKDALYCEEQGKEKSDSPLPFANSTPSLLSFNCYPSTGSFIPTTDKDVIIKRLQVDAKILEQRNSDKNAQLLFKDATIASLQSEITQLRHELTLKENECALHLHSLQVKIDDQLENNLNNHQVEETIRQLEERLKTGKACTGIYLAQCEPKMTTNKQQELVISELRESLTKKELETEQLEEKIELMEGNEAEKIRWMEKKYQEQLMEAFEKQDKYKQQIENLKFKIQDLEITNNETRTVLTHEIAVKHDEIKTLRQELADQSEHHKEIVQQLVLKCEVIKGLRKDLKDEENKLDSTEFELANRKEELIKLQQLLEKQATEIENQKITITNLQEALVQTKRGAVNNSSVIANGSSTKRNSNGNDIFDI